MVERCRVDITPFVGPAFRFLRNRCGASQEEIAFKAGVDRTYVSGVERGVRNPSLKAMQKIAAALEVSLDVVFVRARKLAENSLPAPPEKRQDRR